MNTREYVERTQCPTRFSSTLAAERRTLTRDTTTVLQVNVGKRCNQACRHCHVDAGPARTEVMGDAVLDAVLRVIERDDIPTVDITGGAPELHPRFEHMVSTLRRSGRHVIVRTNLTVLEEDGNRHLPEFYAANAIELIASLPCYLEDNVDHQRGRGVFGASISALRRLNALGYGRPNQRLRLSLVYNPQGPVLPPPQNPLETDYRRELNERFGVSFTRLLTITNMPIGRFADDLERQGELDTYVQLLDANFNAETVSALMCRRTINVGWDGLLYDCDFNAMLGLPMRDERGQALRIHDLASGVARTGAITVGNHCFGCTAGAGSSCGGALTDAPSEAATA